MGKILPPSRAHPAPDLPPGGPGLHRPPTRRGPAIARVPVADRAAPQEPEHLIDAPVVHAGGVLVAVGRDRRGRLDGGLAQVGHDGALGEVEGIACREPRSPAEAPNGVAGSSTTPAVKNRVLELPEPESLPKRRAQRFSMLIGLPAASRRVPTKWPLCGS